MSASLPLQSLDIQEQITRIDRAIAETHKLQRESDKFAAETRKLQRDYLYAPLLTLIAALGGILGLATFLLRLAGRG